MHLLLCFKYQKKKRKNPILTMYYSKLNQKGFIVTQYI